MEDFTLYKGFSLRKMYTTCVKLYCLNWSTFATFHKNQHKCLQQNQEKELEKLRVELSSLKDEETRLETSVDSGKQQLDALVKSQKDLQLQVNQVSINQYGQWQTTTRRAC